MSGMPELTSPVVPGERWAGREQPVLAADGLLLRPWEPSDVERVVEAYRDPDIQRWHVRSMTHQEAARWVESWRVRWAAGAGASWAVVEAGAVVGRTGLRALDLATGAGEVAYWVLPAARGRGVAVRSLDAVSQWMFADVGLHRLELAHSTANPASCRVALRTGYALEGTKRQEGLHADGWHDMHLHARLNPR